MQYLDTLKEIEVLIDKYEFDKCLELIHSSIKTYGDKVELLNLEGKIYTRQQHYADALNVFNRVLIVEPQNEIAAYSIKMINDILKISRTFYFENPYTDDDLYD